jgi:hypothetical protein
METINSRMNSKYSYITKYLNEVKSAFTSINDDIKMIIYGGFVRDLIADKPFNDIDIYIQNLSISANTCNYILSEDIEKRLDKMDDVKDVKILSKISPGAERCSYGSYKIKITLNDDSLIIFDSSLVINGHRKIIFNNICDYSVNNLCVEYTGNEDEPFKNLHLRINNDNVPDVETSIYHINNKLLIPIIDIGKIEKLVISEYKYFCCPEYNEKYMEPLISHFLKTIAERSWKIQTIYKYKHEDEDFDIFKFLINSFHELMESVKSYVD